MAGNGLHECAGLPAKDVNVVGSAVGTGPAARRHPLPVRRQRDREEPSFLVLAYGRAQHLDEAPGRGIPDTHRLVLGGGREPATVSVGSDVPDRRRVHPSFQA